MEDPEHPKPLIQGESFLPIEAAYDELGLTSEELTRLVDAGLIGGDLRDVTGRVVGVLEDHLPRRSEVEGLLAKLDDRQR